MNTDLKTKYFYLYTAFSELKKKNKKKGKKAVK